MTMLLSFPPLDEEDNFLGIFLDESEAEEVLPMLGREVDSKFLDVFLEGETEAEEVLPMLGREADSLFFFFFFFFLDFRLARSCLLEDGAGETEREEEAMLLPKDGRGGGVLLRLERLTDPPPLKRHRGIDEGSSIMMTEFASSCGGIDDCGRLALEGSVASVGIQTTDGGIVVCTSSAISTSSFLLIVIVVEGFFRKRRCN